jgi:hypothetical protein
MGNTECCNGKTDDASAGEISATANRPQKKALAGLAAELDSGLKVNGVGLKEAVLLQAALRGYLSRKLFHRVSFTPQRSDIVEFNVETFPDFANKETKTARKKLAKGDYIIDEVSRDEPLYEFTPVQFNDNSVYSGEWTKSGVREGRGVCYKPDGEVYEGQWSKDMYHGKGRLIMKTGDVYIGEFFEGKADGTGKYCTLEGYLYEGSWVDNLKQGKGLEITADKSTYEGEFDRGVKSGHGVFDSEDGRHYDGTWKHDVMEGYGTLTYPDGKMHEGPWENGKLHGVGRVIEDHMERKAEWNKGRRVRWLS